MAPCREELLLLREEADKKVGELEGQCQELQSVIQQVSEDFQKVSTLLLLLLLLPPSPKLLIHSLFVDFVFQSQSMVSTLEKSLHELQTEHDALKLQQQKVRM